MVLIIEFLLLDLIFSGWTLVARPAEVLDGLRAGVGIATELTSACPRSRGPCLDLLFRIEIAPIGRRKPVPGVTAFGDITCLSSLPARTLRAWSALLYRRGLLVTITTRSRLVFRENTVLSYCVVKRSQRTCEKQDC